MSRGPRWNIGPLVVCALLFLLAAWQVLLPPELVQPPEFEPLPAASLDANETVQGSPEIGSAKRESLPLDLNEGRWTVRVVVAGTMEPISGASVYVFSGETCVEGPGKSKDDGSWSCASPSPEAPGILIYVEASGYGPRCLSPSERASRGEEPVLVELEPGVVIEGVVVTRTGMPLPGQLVGIDLEGMPPSMSSGGFADAEGRFVLRSVPAETRVVLHARGRRGSGVTIETKEAGFVHEDVVLVCDVDRRISVAVVGDQPEGSVPCKIELRRRGQIFKSTPIMGPGTFDLSFPDRREDDALFVHLVLGGESLQSIQLLPNDEAVQMLLPGQVIACHFEVVDAEGEALTGMYRLEEGSTLAFGVEGFVFGMVEGAQAAIDVFPTLEEHFRWEGAVRRRNQIRIPAAAGRVTLHFLLERVGRIDVEAVALNITRIHSDDFQRTVARAPHLLPRRSLRLDAAQAEVRWEGLAPGRYLVSVLDEEDREWGQAVLDVDGSNQAQRVRFGAGTLVWDSPVEETRLRIIGPMGAAEDVRGDQGQWSGPPGEYQVVIDRGGVTQRKRTTLSAGEEQALELDLHGRVLRVRFLCTTHQRNQSEFVKVRLIRAPESSLNLELPAVSDGEYEGFVPYGELELTAGCPGVSLFTHAPDGPSEVSVPDCGSFRVISCVAGSEAYGPAKRLFLRSLGKGGLGQQIEMRPDAEGRCEARLEQGNRLAYMAIYEDGSRGAVLVQKVRDWPPDGVPLHVELPQGRLAMRLTDESGLPVVGARVSVHGRRQELLQTAFPGEVPIAMASSDRDGRVSWAALPEEDCRVEVMFRGKTRSLQMRPTRDAEEQKIELR